MDRLAQFVARSAIDSLISLGSVQWRGPGPFDHFHDRILETNILTVRESATVTPTVDPSKFLKSSVDSSHFPASLLMYSFMCSIPGTKALANTRGNLVLLLFNCTWRMTELLGYPMRSGVSSTWRVSLHEPPEEVASVDSNPIDRRKIIWVTSTLRQTTSFYVLDSGSHPSTHVGPHR